MTISTQGMQSVIAKQRFSRDRECGDPLARHAGFHIIGDIDFAHIEFRNRIFSNEALLNLHFNAHLHWLH